MWSSWKVFLEGNNKHLAKVWQPGTASAGSPLAKRWLSGPCAPGRVRGRQVLPPLFATLPRAPYLWALAGARGYQRYQRITELMLCLHEVLLPKSRADPGQPVCSQPRGTGIVSLLSLICTMQDYKWLGWLCSYNLQKPAGANRPGSPRSLLSTFKDNPDRVSFFFLIC